MIENKKFDPYNLRKNLLLIRQKRDNKPLEEINSIIINFIENNKDLLLKIMNHLTKNGNLGYQDLIKKPKSFLNEDDTSSEEFINIFNQISLNGDILKEKERILSEIYNLRIKKIGFLEEEIKKLESEIESIKSNIGLNNLEESQKNLKEINDKYQKIKKNIEILNKKNNITKAKINNIQNGENEIENINYSNTESKLNENNEIYLNDKDKEKIKEIVESLENNNNIDYIFLRDFFYNKGKIKIYGESFRERIEDFFEKIGTKNDRSDLFKKYISNFQNLENLLAKFGKLIEKSDFGSFLGSLFNPIIKLNIIAEKNTQKTLTLNKKTGKEKIEEIDKLDQLKNDEKLLFLRFLKIKGIDLDEEYIHLGEIIFLDNKDLKNEYLNFLSENIQLEELKIKRLKEIENTENNEYYQMAIDEYTTNLYNEILSILHNGGSYLFTKLFELLNSNLQDKVINSLESRLKEIDLSKIDSSEIEKINEKIGNLLNKIINRTNNTTKKFYEKMNILIEILENFRLNNNPAINTSTSSKSNGIGSGSNTNTINGFISVLCDNLRSYLNEGNIKGFESFFYTDSFKKLIYQNSDTDLDGIRESWFLKLDGKKSIINEINIISFFENIGIVMKESANKNKSDIFSDKLIENIKILVKQLKEIYNETKIEFEKIIKNN